VPTCSLLAIGNELLNGEIRDLNLFTLSRSLTRLGFHVSQAVLARDDPTSIAHSLTYLLAAAPDLLICCGGLGPTEDDLTLHALAEALGRNLCLHPKARQMVEAQYAQLMSAGYLEQRGPEDAREKMARLPDGAWPLPNPVGTAPGVCLQVGSTLIYVLPGVPAELNAIFETTIVPELRAHFTLGYWAQAALRVYVDDEAEVAAPLRRASAAHPDVYLKSLAQPFPAAGREGLRIIASVNGPTEPFARKAVADALGDLGLALEAVGLRFSREEAAPTPQESGSHEGGRDVT
jgi:nicotinamide-nucleotide amidase